MKSNKVKKLINTIYEQIESKLDGNRGIKNQILNILQMVLITLKQNLNWKLILKYNINIKP